MSDNPQQWPEVFAKCKRGNDVVTQGQSCDNKMAYKMSVDGASAVSFKCTKCKFVWTIDVGGTFTAC